MLLSIEILLDMKSIPLLISSIILSNHHDSFLLFDWLIFKTHFLIYYTSNYTINYLIIYFYLFSIKPMYHLRFFVFLINTQSDRLMKNLWLFWIGESFISYLQWTRIKNTLCLWRNLKMIIHINFNKLKMNLLIILQLKKRVKTCHYLLISIISKKQQYKSNQLMKRVWNQVREDVDLLYSAFFRKSSLW